MRRGAPARRTRGRLSQSRQAVPVSRRPACLGHRILGQHQHQPTRRKHRHHGGYGPVPASQGPPRRNPLVQSRLRRLAARMTSLADLQAEREKLRALDAKEEFEAAIAETCLDDSPAQSLSAGPVLRTQMLELRIEVEVALELPGQQKQHAAATDALRLEVLSPRRTLHPQRVLPK